LWFLFEYNIIERDNQLRVLLKTY